MRPGTDRIILTLLLILCTTACTEETDTERIVKMEILYTFRDSDKTCTRITGKGGIEDVTPADVINDLDKSIQDLGYLSVTDRTITWEMPWPFDDITEKVSRPPSGDSTLLFRGEKRIPRLSFTARHVTDNITLLIMSGTICYDMPQFIKENVYSSCIKDIIKSIRSHY